jgi:5-methyltetrahydropteroyltriglutamate--homocysteine methyltransferase
MASLDRIRTDVVGSLLRPARWKEARQLLDAGTLSADEFARIELDCVRSHVAMQEAIGLDVVTDGELSRLNFQDSFGLAVSGYDTAGETLASTEHRVASGTAHSRFDMPDLAAAGTPVVHRRPVVQKLKLERNVPLEEFRRVAPLATKPVKVSLIGPDRIQQRFDFQKSRNVYASVEDFLDDVVTIQRQMIQALAVFARMNAQEQIVWRRRGGHHTDDPAPDVGPEISGQRNVSALGVEHGVSTRSADSRGLTRRCWRGWPAPALCAESS